MDRIGLQKKIDFNTYPDDQVIEFPEKIAVDTQNFDQIKKYLQRTQANSIRIILQKIGIIQKGKLMSLIKSFKNEILSYLFVINGRKPWSLGYNSYKWNTIKKYIEQDLFKAGNLFENYGFRIDERIVEYPWLLSRLSKKEGLLLDAGSILNYELILSYPALVNKKKFILTLSPEGNCFWKSGISYIFEDLRNCCFKDNYFDWVVCISTLEHIGLDNTMLYTNDPSKKENENRSYLSAIKEYYRILKPGGMLFITTPYGKY